MTELYVKDSEIAFPEIPQYTYKRRDEYRIGLNTNYWSYNNMKNNIIFLQNVHTNYKEIEQYYKKIANKIDNIQIDEKRLGSQIGIHEKVEIYREIHSLQRVSHRSRKGFESREIEVRVYI